MCVIKSAKYYRVVMMWIPPSKNVKLKTLYRCGQKTSHN